MVPVDTSDLQSTGRVEPTPQGHTVVYGGKAGAATGAFVYYADAVHDDLSPRKYKRKGSGPKFVETHGLRRSPEGVLLMQATLKELALGLFKK